jgi:glycogen debranching enzyme
MLRAVSRSIDSFSRVGALRSADRARPFPRPTRVASLISDSFHTARLTLADAVARARGLPFVARLDGCNTFGIKVETLAQTLCELGGVERLSELGRNGPLRASAGANGIYNCLFGRDAIQQARDTLRDFPEVARRTILDLAHLQGVAFNPLSEEEPGRILHEHRPPGDPMVAALREKWGLPSMPYFGTTDATPQFVNLISAYCARYGDDVLSQLVLRRDGKTVSVLDCVQDALTWTERRMDQGHGYVCVKRLNPRGPSNQIFEDSEDSQYYEDGTLLSPDHGYAPVAVQGYAYDALLAGAKLLERTPGMHRLPPAELRQRAAVLRKQVMSEMWQEDLRCFAMAIGYDENGVARPARTVSSAAGHLLASRILDGGGVYASRARKLARRLMQEDMFPTGGAGIRTKSSSAARYGPGTYHNGSVWPMDNGVIADGMRRHGFYRRANRIERHILGAMGTTGSFDETFRGESGGIRVNTQTVDLMKDGSVRVTPGERGHVDADLEVLERREQPGQAWQGWSATAAWKLLRRRGLPAFWRGS